MLSKEAILDLLKSDKRAVARALVVLHERQTFDERAQEGTRYLNGRGFRPCHARMGSSMAKQFLNKGFLSDKQINYWRVLDKTGSMRIGIYWGQLLEEAQRKAEKPVTVVCFHKAPTEVARDYGNDMEELMVLHEMVASDNNPEIQERIDELDTFWKKLKEKQNV